MAAVRRSNTKPELALRSALHVTGLRFRKDYPLRVPGGRAIKPDVVFTRAGVAVFVHGCFWHCCPQHASYPKDNAEWWAAKLARNVERDRQTERRLAEAGWEVVVVWEHEDPAAAAVKVADLVAVRLKAT